MKTIWQYNSIYLTNVFVLFLLYYCFPHLFFFLTALKIFFIFVFQQFDKIYLGEVSSVFILLESIKLRDDVFIKFAKFYSLPRDILLPLFTLFYDTLITHILGFLISCKKALTLFISMHSLSVL